MKKLIGSGLLILVLTAICAVGIDKVMPREEDKSVRAVVKISLPEQIEEESKPLLIDRTKETA